MAFRQVKTQTSFEDRHVSEPTVGTVMENAFHLAWRDTEVNSLARNRAFRDLNERGEKISPGILNEKYPGLDKPFSRPMTMLAAQWISDETAERRQREAVISRATGFWKGIAAPFVAGAGAAVTDPIGFGVGAALGGIAGPISKAVAGAGRGAGAVRAGITFAENAVANSLSEFAFTKQAADRELQEYTASQMLTNIVGGSLAATGISEGLGFLAKLGSKRAQIADTTYRTAETALEEGKSVSAMLDTVEGRINKDLEITPQVRDLVDETFEGRVGAEDMASLRDNLLQAVDEGKISMEEVSAFRGRLQQAGIPQEKMDILADDYRPSTETIEGVRENFVNETLDRDYNPRSREILQQEDIRAGEPELEDLDLRKSDLRAKEDLSEFEAKELREIEKLEKEEQAVEASLGLADCLVGVIGGQ